MDTWIGCFETAHGTPQGKDSTPLIRLLPDRGEEEVSELIKLFHDRGTRWYRENAAWTVGAFASQYNALLAMKAGGNL